MMKKGNNKYKVFAKKVVKAMALGAEMMPMYGPGMPTSMYYNYGYGVNPYLYEFEEEKEEACEKKAS